MTLLKKFVYICIRHDLVDADKRATYANHIKLFERQTLYFCILSKISFADDRSYRDSSSICQNL